MFHPHKHTYLPVLNFKPLMQPPAEKQWLWRNFLYVHAVKVYVDSGTFFAQEFCRTQKIKETKQKQEKLFCKTARRVSTKKSTQGDNDGVELRDAVKPKPFDSKVKQSHV